MAHSAITRAADWRYKANPKRHDTLHTLDVVIDVSADNRGPLREGRCSRGPGWAAPFSFVDL